MTTNAQTGPHWGHQMSTLARNGFELFEWLPFDGVGAKRAAVSGNVTMWLFPSCVITHNIRSELHVIKTVCDASAHCGIKCSMLLPHIYEKGRGRPHPKIAFSSDIPPTIFRAKEEVKAAFRFLFKIVAPRAISAPTFPRVYYQSTNLSSCWWTSSPCAPCPFASCPSGLGILSDPRALYCIFSL